MLQPRVSARIERLRERALVSPSIRADRDLLVTRSYAETEGEPMIIRRAKALKKVLEEMPLAIGEDELIVGNTVAGIPRCAGLFLELSTEWKERELDNFSSRKADRFLIDEGEKERFRQLFSFWKGKTVQDRAMALMPEETLRLMQAKYPAFDVNLHLRASGLGHVALGYARALQKGFLGIREEALSRASQLDLADPSDLKKLAFLKAVAIVCEGAARFGWRYSELAREMAARAQGRRRAELEAIADICSRVPAYGARTFWEAIQCFWFVQVITQIESDGTAISPGRFDQYMYPFYREDLEKGRITPDQAQELVDCLWIKFNEILKVWDEEGAKGFGGFPISQNLCVGGQTRAGLDATNPVSYMCLTALEHVRLPQPALSVRVHSNTPEDFLLRVCEVIKLGTGMPAVYNDEAIIPAMLTRGISLEDARDYAIVGCVEPSVNGRDWPRSNGGFFNLAKALELALNDGVCRLSGEVLGLRTGDPKEFTSFDELMEAFRKQVAYLVRHCAIANNTIELAHAQMQPLPFVSSLTEDCLARGLDVTEGGALYNATGPLGVGVANVANSLAALKKLVFEERVLTMEQVLEALQRDFDGYEIIREILKNKAPKYGNDDEYVDDLARQVCAIYCDEVRKYRNTAGGQFQPAFIPVSGNVPLGKVVAALPEGRNSGMPLAEGVSPAQGTDKKGPTAVLKSVGRLDHCAVPLGILLNQKFHPSALEGESGTRKLASLLRTFVALKLQHVQFNVVSAETLREAQKHPEKYRDLVVRVAGYSAFFNDLDRAIQDDIIARTEQRAV